MTLEPQIYVACLAAYNSGVLHGEWIDADQDADDIRAEIQAMLQRSPIPNAEEWAIHDYQGFGDLSIDENESIDRIAEVAQAIAEHGVAYALYVQDVGIESASLDGFQEAYHGQYDSEADFAEELYSETHTIPDFLQMYIAWERVARDLFISDYSSTRYNGSTFVFRRI